MTIYWRSAALVALAPLDAFAQATKAIFATTDIPPAFSRSSARPLCGSGASGDGH
jgi:hypothetical protein